LLNYSNLSFVVCPTAKLKINKLQKEMSTAGGKSRTSSAAQHGGRMTAASTDNESENPFK
jgi:hypothetical protein